MLGKIKRFRENEQALYSAASPATACLIKKQSPLRAGYSAVGTWGVFYLPLKHPAISTGRNKTPDHRDSRACLTGQSFRSHLQTHQTFFRQ